jgi:sulfur-carrier protein
VASGAGGEAEGGVTLLLFAAAREAAGTGRETVPGTTVAQVITAAERRHGAAFAQVVAASRVWVNGEPAASDAAVAAGDEVAVLPPVSGGQ